MGTGVTCSHSVSLMVAVKHNQSLLPGAWGGGGPPEADGCCDEPEITTGYRGGGGLAETRGGRGPPEADGCCNERLDEEQPPEITTGCRGGGGLPETSTGCNEGGK